MKMTAFTISSLSRIYLPGLCLILTVVLSQTHHAAAQETALELFQSRVSALEDSVKDIRGQLEEQELAARQGGSGEDIADLRNQIEKIADELSSLSNRLERTLSAVSDNEFRLLRMEKRMESLMRLGIDQSLDDTATGPSNTGAGEVPGSSINSSQDQSTVWTMNADELEESLSGNDDGDAIEGGTEEEPADEKATDEASDLQSEAAPAIESVLPEASPEDQYQFALGKALQNDLATAENAFEEFTRVHDNHDRTADAFFWLGRVQFKRGAYEKSVMTFSNFQTQWPNDSRVEKTTLWIGEAVSNFAPKEDVCDLLTSLPSFVPNPTENFFVRLDKLKNQAACNG